MNQEYRSKQLYKYKKSLEKFKQELSSVSEILAENNDVPKCPICLEHVIQDHKITKCGHIFHKNCISGLHTCPVCRYKFTKLSKTVQQLIAEHIVNILFSL